MEPIAIFLSITVVLGLRWAILIQIAIIFRAISGQTRDFKISGVKIEFFEIVFTTAWAVGAVLTLQEEWKTFGLVLFWLGFISYIFNLGWKATVANS